MTDVLNNSTSLATVATGYKVLHVAARIMDMDVDAQGDGKNAAWRRYFVLTVMATIKAVDRKGLARMVFGQDGKPSKTFGNIFALAVSAYAAMATPEEYNEIRAMGIDDAYKALIDLLDRHMSILSVAGKNEYAKFCMFATAEQAATHRSQIAANAAEAAADGEPEAAADGEPEAVAQVAAANQPERTAAQAAIAALHEASRDDLMSVAAAIAVRLSVEDLRTMAADLAAMVANIDAAATAKAAKKIAA
ncbi:hypothetical protein [Rhizobium arsenicireducens]